jgi:hypothetical protein
MNAINRIALSSRAVPPVMGIQEHGGISRAHFEKRGPRSFRYSRRASRRVLRFA